MWMFPVDKPQMHNNIGPTSVQKVCDEHYSACKLPDQKKTAMQTHSVAQPVTWVGRRWGRSQHPTNITCPTTAPPTNLSVENIKESSKG